VKRGLAGWVSGYLYARVTMGGSRQAGTYIGTLRVSGLILVIDVCVPCLPCAGQLLLR
jgi:hypothetical protein